MTFTQQPFFRYFHQWLLMRIFFKKFIYFWLCWVFVAVHELSLVAVRGGYSSFRCTGFSLWRLLLLRSMGSRHVGFSSCGSQALECRLSSCGARTQLLHGMWDLLGLGLEPVFPALAGGFLILMRIYFYVFPSHMCYEIPNPRSRFFFFLSILRYYPKCYFLFKFMYGYNTE